MTSFGSSVGGSHEGVDAARTDTIRLVIAEDHGVVADGIVTMLSFEDDIEVLSIVDTGEALLDEVRDKDPDIAIVDISLAGEMTGLDAVRVLYQEGVRTRSMALTMFTDHDTVTRAVAAGIAGYLPKNVGRDEFVQAIRAVATGKGFLHPDVTRPFLDRIGQISANSEFTPLSDREQEVLEELAKGSSTREIADDLGLGHETVKSHLSRIYQKLRVQDRVQAVVIAMRHGLVR